MKIVVYSTKWSAGKTPISTNIALDRGFAIGTNEPYHVFDGFIPNNRLLHVDLNEPFPAFDSKIDIVFDLAGSRSSNAQSITSAIKQADLVLVPIYNEVKSIKAGLHTLAEIIALNPNVAVIGTKLQKRWSKDRFVTWNDCEDMKNVRSAVHQQLSNKIKVLPLKLSTVFDAIFERELSIRQMMDSSPLLAYQYREVAKQFDEIYNLIDSTHAK